MERLPERLGSTWKDMPDEIQSRMLARLDRLPGSLKGWKELIDKAVAQMKLAAGRKRVVAIVGPANAGKSTLYNQLVRARRDRAKVSAIPGTTRQVQEADAGLFLIIDTPGADMAGSLGEIEKERALHAARQADLLIVLFDASHGIRQAEMDLYAELSALEKPTVVALNKIDLVWRQREAVIAKASSALEDRAEGLVALSAKSGRGVEKLLQEIVRIEPGIVAALGAAMPAYRWELAQAVITRSASTAGVVALTPLPFLDFIPLVGIQVAMVLGIARVFAYRLTLGRARELVVTFGVGILARSLFYELSKLGGPPTWILAAGVAAGTTAALGLAAAVWFERGERLSREALSRISRLITEHLVERLKSIGKRRPKRKSLQERMREVLEEIDLQDLEADAEGRSDGEPPPASS